MAVKIVTDSVCDLPPQVVKELGITVIPIIIRWGEQLYRDGIDLTPEQFYEKLKSNKIPPSTSVPSPGTFAEVYDRLAQETDEICAVILSARLSGTYNVALQSVGLMKKKCRVEVIDSQCGTMAEGFVVMEAARAAQAGAGIDEVVSIARRTILRIDMLATFDTLEYLKRGGRIGKAQAFLGSVLKVNPLVTLRDGSIEPVGRTHSRARAIDRLYEFAMGYSQIDEMAIEEATTPDQAEKLVKRIAVKFPRERIYRVKPSPVIGAHTGPGFMIVVILGDKSSP